MVLLLEYNIFVLFPPLLTIVSATGAGGHCKGKRELFIAEGKRLRCVGLCCKRRQLRACACGCSCIGHGKVVVTFSRAADGQ